MNGIPHVMLHSLDSQARCLDEPDHIAVQMAADDSPKERVDGVLQIPDEAD